VVPQPAFPVHIWGPVIAGANVIGVTMNQGEEHLLQQIAHVAQHMTPRPKVLILNYPHNPTARTVELDFFKEVMKLARRHDFYVISDFAYGLTCFDGWKAPSMLEVPGAKDRAVELFTMSKAWNMAGWRVGFCVGNPDMISLLGRIKGFYDYGIFQAIQISSIIALRHCQEEVDKQAALYAARRDLLCQGLTEMGFEVEKPRATMFVWARIPERFQAMGSIDFSLMLLDKAEVATSPGGGFGEEGEGYLRIALVENESRIRQALRQMRRVLQAQSSTDQTPETVAADSTE
jgi:alanine-synthesizing transaminase